MFNKKRNFTKKPEKTRILTRFYEKRERDGAIASLFRVKNRARHSQLLEQNAIGISARILLFVLDGENIGESCYVECPIKSTAVGSEVSEAFSNALVMQRTSESVSSIS